MDPTHPKPWSYNHPLQRPRGRDWDGWQRLVQVLEESIISVYNKRDLINSEIYLHVLRICLPTHPCDNSIVECCHYEAMQRVKVASGEMRDLLRTKRPVSISPSFEIRGACHKGNHIPLTRLLLDSNFVSITDILGSSKLSFSNYLENNASNWWAPRLQKTCSPGQ